MGEFDGDSPHEFPQDLCGHERGIRDQVEPREFDGDSPYEFDGDSPHEFEPREFDGDSPHEFPESEGDSPYDSMGTVPMIFA